MKLLLRCFAVIALVVGAPAEAQWTENPNNSNVLETDQSVLTIGEVGEAVEIRSALDAHSFRMNDRSTGAMLFIYNNFIRFWKTPENVEVARIDANGNLGLGTTPTAPLHIAKNSPVMILEDLDGGGSRPQISVRGNQYLIFEGDDTENKLFSFYSTFSANRNYDAEIRVHGSSAASWSEFLSIKHDGTKGIVQTSTGSPLVLEASGGLSDITLNPSSTGNVGIGTDSPQSRLDVNGTITADAMNLVGQLSAGSITTSSLNLTNLTVQSLDIPGIRGVDLGGGSYVKPVLILGLEKLQLHGPVGTEVLGDFTVTSGQTRLQATTITGFLTGQGAHFGDLGVGGKIEAMEIEVTMNPVPDYVFADDYELTPLLELEAEIDELGHLPKFPSAEEVAAKGGGVNLGEMNRKLLEKVEELTLYLIDLKKENVALLAGQIGLKQENEALGQRLGLVEAMLASFSTRL